MSALPWDVAKPRKSWAGVSDEDKRKAETQRKKPTRNNSRNARRAAMAGTMYPHECEHCHNSFQSLRRTKRYCSKACMRLAYKARQLVKEVS
jgi:hypothetical protein